MNNVVFWDIKTQFLLHRKRFYVFTAVTMKNAIFWDIKKPSLYFTEDTLLLRYRAQPVNAT
jgi:hypothetical protein